LIININKSFNLGLVLSGLHGLAAFSVMISGLHWVIVMVLVSIIVLNSVHQARLHVTRSHANSIQQLNTGSSGLLKIKLGIHRDWVATEVESVTIWPGLIMLKLTALHPVINSQNLLIVSDALVSDEFRHMSAWANQASLTTQQKAGIDSL
jgi:hypothetical protein